MFDEMKAYVASKGLPPEDGHGLPRSTRTFPDGAHFRIEIPTINNPVALKSLLEHAASFEIELNRISLTYGIMRFTDREIRECLALSRQYGAEVFMMVGPRAVLDIGAQAHIASLNAQQVAYRLRGMDQVVYALEDVKRAVDLGCRGFIVCDDGLLYLLNEMRRDGVIPGETQFKASVLLGTANPVHARLLQEAGADSINVQRDLPLALIAGIRQAVSVPLDVHANNPEQTGGFVRTYEVPRMVEVAAPMYVKTGNVAVTKHSMWVDEGAGYRMAREAYLTVYHIRKYLPTARQTRREERTLALPAA